MINGLEAKDDRYKVTGEYIIMMNKNLGYCLF